MNHGPLTLSDSTVSGNHANRDGGGIVNGGMLTITNNTISGNTANNIAGGIYNLNGGRLDLGMAILNAGGASGGISSTLGVWLPHTATTSVVTPAAVC